MSAMEKRGRLKQWDELPPEEQGKVQHELKVHQCEVERKIQELLRAQAKLTDLSARYFDLYDLAPDGIVTPHQAKQSSQTFEEPSPVKQDYRSMLLLVEDDAMIAMSEQMELERCGYHVVVAGTGEEAIEICRNNPAIDLILMDIDLGVGMDGPEAATQILKAHWVPVLFLSSHTDPEVVAQTERISSYGYVVKNSGITVLDASIKMALKLFQSTVRLESKKDFLQLAEEALLKTQERLALAMDQSQLAYWEMDATTKTFTFNDQFYMIYATTADREGGYQMPAEVYAREFLPMEEQHLVSENIAKLLSGEITELQLEHRIRRRDGELRHIFVCIKVVRDDAGRVVSTRGINQDITVRKQAEEQRQESMTKLREVSLYTRNLIETSLDPLVTISPEGKISDVNAATERVTGVNRDKLIGSDFSDYFTDLEKAKAGYKCVFSDGQVIDYPLAIRHTSGAITDVLYNASVYRNEKGEVLGVFAAARDITQRKQAEEKIKTLLEEKERLLEEVHHRTKNNMYAIKNLLAIQASTVSESAGRANLLEAANRVQSMMLLYDNLLQSSDYLSVSTRSFLSGVADSVVASFSGNVSMTVEKEIEDCLLSAGKTQPLGLILNEVLTNSMKHAFVGRASGKVAVTFHVSEGRGVLVVQDDGAGMPDSIDFKNSSSLGLKLIPLLAKQIGGTVRVERGQGTKVIVEFPT